jgi:hypothetical protein
MNRYDTGIMPLTWQAPASINNNGCVYRKSIYVDNREASLLQR